MKRSYVANRHAAVLAWARKQEEIEVGDVMAAHGMARPNAQQLLSRMAKEGHIKRLRQGVYGAVLP